MKITVIAFTKKGADICKELTKSLVEKGHDAKGFSKYNCNDLFLVEEDIYSFTKKAFETSTALVYIGAIAIAVRAIAPVIVSKDKDPAVIVVDELAEHVIPILSGHIGGANKLAKQIASLIEGKTVITTATDINDVFAIDLWAKENDLRIDNIENIKHVSSSLLHGDKVGFYSEFPVDGKIPSVFNSQQKDVDVGVCIYNSMLKNTKVLPFKKTLFMTPKNFVVGIGCKRDTNEKVLEQLVLKTLLDLNIPIDLVVSIATIDIKKEELAIISLCEKYNYQLKVYSNKELSKAEGEFTRSEFVKNITGVDNVCERAAFLASDRGEIVLKKTVENGIAIAVFAKKWRCVF